VIIVSAVALCSCGDAESGEEGADFGEDKDNGNNGGGDDNAANNGNPGPGDPDPQPEPEPEERFNFQRPQPSRDFVFVSNPDLDTVAKIDGATLEITSIEVGDRPTVVRTSPHSNTAIALNEGSHDVSIIHADVDRDEVVTLPIREGFNQLVMAPSGHWALAYLDYASGNPDAPALPDIGRFQDVNLIVLQAGEEAVHNIAVGFHVLEIEFNDEGDHAYIITEDGLSVLDLTRIEGDISAPPLPLSEDPFEDAQAVDREVEVSGDGSFALVRSTVLQGINVISLPGGELTHIPLDGVPTDLDIYPDSLRAIAVLKDARAVAILDLTDLEADPRTISIPDGPLGLAAMDFQANLALLYSVASGEQRVTRLDVDSGEQVVWDVRKRIEGLQLNPSGDRAVIFHGIDAAPRSSAAADVFLAGTYAYTLLDVRTGFAKLQTTPTRPGEFVFTLDDEWMFLVLEEAAINIQQVERVNLLTFRVDRYNLGSPPEHIGLLPSDDRTRIYISQNHPVGRMTFIDVDSGRANTVTGYELNSQID
jgi:DNA-binding beta-propeller fold protein YncE